MAKESILSVEGLTKRYDDGTVTVKSIDFDVKRGEVFGILGPNGAGKTTTLEMIEGMRPISAGQVHLNGIDVSKEPYHVKEIIGVQLQSSSFFDLLSLREILVLFSSLYAQSAHPDKLLKEVNLEEKASARVKNLSGGQKQRFSIATALVNKPVAIFLDEPTTGLDPQARRNLWDLVQQIQKTGTTVIMTTHYMEEAQILCDRVAIMDDGRIIALDTPSNLIDELLKRGFKPKHQVQSATLEDVFIDLTGKDLRE